MKTPEGKYFWHLFPQIYFHLNNKKTQSTLRWSMFEDKSPVINQLGGEELTVKTQHSWNIKNFIKTEYLEI